jgi:hypothetical protein
MDDRQRLEAIVSVICRYLPPDGIPINDAMSEIISYVDPLPAPQPAQEPERETLKLALEALEDLPGFRADIDNAITAIKEALAQPMQEPVAFDEFLESQDFYELMQTYRHCLTDAFLPFEEVKNALRAAHIGEMK